MAHSIEICRTVAAIGWDEKLDPDATAEILPPLDAMDDPVVELSRRYPGLSRALAEYLAR